MLSQVARHMQLYDTWDPRDAVRLMRVFPVTTLFGMPAYRDHWGTKCKKLSSLNDAMLEDAQEQFYESLRGRRWREAESRTTRRRVAGARGEAIADSARGSAAPTGEVPTHRPASNSHAHLEYSEDAPEHCGLARWLFGRKEYWHGGHVEEDMLGACARGDLLPAGTPIIVMHQKRLRLDKTCGEFECGGSSGAAVDSDCIPRNVDEFCFAPGLMASSRTTRRSLVRALDAVKHVQVGYAPRPNDLQRCPLAGTVLSPWKARMTRPRHGSWVQLTGQAMYIAPSEEAGCPYVLVCRTYGTQARGEEFFCIPALPGVNDGTRALAEEGWEGDETSPNQSQGGKRKLQNCTISPDKRTRHTKKGNGTLAAAMTPKRRVCVGDVESIRVKRNEGGPRRLQFHHHALET